MATTTAPPQKRFRRSWRVVRWVLSGILGVLVALVVFAFVRPLTLLWFATQARLFSEGIHSDYTEIPFAGSPRVRVHYYSGGSGSPVVLVHGLGGRAEDWANLMPQLVRDHHRVYALDLPGYGRSDWPSADYSIAEFTAAVEAFMDNRGLQQTDLAGWSMGGWIAMRVALEQPQRIRRLVIFDSAGTRFTLTWDTSLFEPDTPAKLAELDDLLMPGKAPHVPGFIERDIFRFVGKHGWVVKRNMDSLLTGVDLLTAQNLNELRMPMLIVWGGQDQLIPVAAGDAMHRAVPQSEFVVVDGCGHLAPGQCAGQIGPVFKGFLDETSPIGGQRAEILKKP